MNAIRWIRRVPDSASNFDLVLASPQQLDSERLRRMLDSILEEKHRGLTLSGRAEKEFRRWFKQPDTPLKSAAYVLLSNWFMTRSGDRHSMVASRCESLWDVLFPCRPAERLSSSQPGRNHVIVPAAFDGFWRRVLEVQGEAVNNSGGVRLLADGKPGSRSVEPSEVGESSAELLRARLVKDGLHCEVEGSPRAVAEFLQAVSSWKPPAE